MNENTQNALICQKLQVIICCVEKIILLMHFLFIVLFSFFVAVINHLKSLESNTFALECDQTMIETLAYGKRMKNKLKKCFNFEKFIHIISTFQQFHFIISTKLNEKAQNLESAFLRCFVATKLKRKKMITQMQKDK